MSYTALVHMLFKSLSDYAETLTLMMFVEFLLQVIEYCEQVSLCGLVVSLVASQQEGAGIESRSTHLTSAGVGPFCVEPACSLHVCVGSLQVLRLPPTVQTLAG